MTCPCCQSSSHLFFNTRDYNRRTNLNVFNYYKCSSCDLVFLSPQPENINKYYQTEFYYIPSSIEELSRNAKGEKYKVKLLKQFVSSGTLLDIGPGPGGFLYWAQKEGFKVEALEMNKQCCKFISEVLKIPAIQGEGIREDLYPNNLKNREFDKEAPQNFCSEGATIAERQGASENENYEVKPTQSKTDSSSCLGIPKDRKYDVISLWHVLEHLAFPWKALEEIALRLNPGGILVIAMPNRNALQFKVLGRYWPHVDAPRHFQLIPDDLLISSLKRFGCSLLYKTTNDEGGLSWNLFGWDRSLKNLVRSRLLKKATKLLSWIICYFLLPFERREGNGAAYTLIFKKESN